jgi:hypothetical protein
MNIELFDPNDISLGVITVTRSGPSGPKMRSYDESRKLIGEEFCSLYKEWDGNEDLINNLSEVVFDKYGIVITTQTIDYDIYACK